MATATKIFFPVSTFSESELSSVKSLILPIVSTGNVGQLAIDLILKAGFEGKFSIKKIGFLESEDVLPLCGYDSYQNNTISLCSNVEVFLCEEQSTVILQIRAPVIQGRESSFTKSLLSWAQQAGFDQLLALSGASSDQSHEDSAGVIFQPCWVANNHATEKPCALLDCLSNSNLLGIPEIHGQNDEMGMPYSGFPRGAGICKQVFKTGDELKLPVIALVKYCSEGNNLEDGIELASCLNQLVTFIDERPDQSGGLHWSFPASWSSIFGYQSNVL